MVEFYIARIAEKDYEAFRRILGKHIPDTYNEWRHLRDHEIAKHRSDRVEIVEVEVYPDEFTRFCDRFKMPADLKMLDDLANEKGSRPG